MEDDQSKAIYMTGNEIIAQKSQAYSEPLQTSKMDFFA